MTRLLGFALLASTLGPPLIAQNVVDRGALAILHGADTLVVDRFVRTADTLRGTVQVKGQPRLDYLAVLAPNNMVNALLLGVFTAGAPANAAPAQVIRMRMRGDTVVVETPAGVQRVPTKVGAIPMFNNALALAELSTRRARVTKGVANVPYFAVSGGVTLDVEVRPGNGDSLTVTIATQVQRFRVDPVGRILGGVVPAQKLEFVRLGPDAAAGLNVTLRDTVAPPPA